MLVKRIIRPFMYEEGTVVSSAQRRNLIGSGTSISIPVGETITIQEDMEKIITIEYFGDIRIERYFLRYYPLDENEFIPIYIKFIDRNGAHVHLIRSGIEYALNALAISPDKKVRFLKTCLFEIVLEETYCLDRFLYETLRESCDKPSHFQYLSEDSAVFIPDTNNRITYPWNIVNYDNEAFRIFIKEHEDNYVKHMSNALYDLSVQVNLNEMNYNSHPISGWMDSVFGLDLGSYDRLAFDRLTDKSLREPALQVKDVYRDLGCLDTHRKFHIFRRYNYDEYIPIEEFTSELMLLCVWLHNLPYTEIIFKYILLNRRLGREASFAASIPIGVSHVDIKSLEYILNNIWSNLNIASITVMMNGLDEVFLEIEEESGEISKYYIDLFLTTLLSQSIVRLPEE